MKLELVTVFVNFFQHLCFHSKLALACVKTWSGQVAIPSSFRDDDNDDGTDEQFPVMMIN